MKVTTPPTSFDPLRATSAQLAEFDFPEQPGSDSGLNDWSAAMSAYTSDLAPTGQLAVADSSSDSVVNSTYYRNWAGYIDGALGTQSHAYVAIKSVFYVPTNLQTCDLTHPTGFWIGLGGTNDGHDLVQQGVECGDTVDLGSGTGYKAFTEFADTKPPVEFCGYAWALTAGHKIYQNMSFQTSSNTAFFYLEDESSGVTHSCSRTAPTGWNWDLNTSEWIGEAASPTDSAVEFTPVNFSDANTELSSTSSWVTLGSQPVSKTIDGVSAALYCIAPTVIGSDQESFTDDWHSNDCS
jgi:hypothetical protein